MRCWFARVRGDSALREAASLVYGYLHFVRGYFTSFRGYLPFVHGYFSSFRGYSYFVRGYFTPFRGYSPAREYFSPSRADLRFQRLSIHPSYARFSLANAKKSVPLLEALFFNLSRIHVVILSNVYFFFNDFFFNDIAISIYAVSIRYVVVTICTI